MCAISERIEELNKKGMFVTLIQVKNQEYTWQCNLSASHLRYAFGLGTDMFDAMERAEKQMIAVMAEPLPVVERLTAVEPVTKVRKQLSKITLSDL